MENFDKTNSFKRLLGNTKVIYTNMQKEKLNKDFFFCYINF